MPHSQARNGIKFISGLQLLDCMMSAGCDIGCCNEKNKHLRFMGRSVNVVGGAGFGRVTQRLGRTVLEGAALKPRGLSGGYDPLGERG